MSVFPPWRGALLGLASSDARFPPLIESSRTRKKKKKKISANISQNPRKNLIFFEETPPRGSKQPAWQAEEKDGDG